MPKNQYGFVLKRYRQPTNYRELFGKANAVYTSNGGKTYYLEAEPHFLASIKWGAEIDHYNILIQHPNCRRTIWHDIKSQKKAMEKLEKLLETT